MTARPAFLVLALVAWLVAGCAPQQVFTPRLTSDLPETPTPAPQSPSQGSLELTAEQGLAVVMEAWSRLLELYVDPADPIDLLRAAWDGFSSALPAGQEKPPFPEMTGNNPQRDLLRFRTAYLTEAARAGGGLEGQARLAHAAIRSMTASLGDCLTSFTDAVQLQEQAAQQRADGRIAGVGIRIKRRPNEPIVIWELLEGGSAGKAGIKPGDAIVKVDGREITGLAIDQIAAAIRGPEGSSVKLTVERADGKRVQDFTLKRVPLADPSFQSKLLPGNVAYFRVYGFSPEIQTELLGAIRELEPKSPRGWILDLRTNSNSDLGAMQSTLSKFLKSGPFAYDVDRVGRRAALGPDGSYLPKQRPLVLLVSDSTSSAAEVFASAIHHHRAGTVVGGKTAGCVGSGARYQLPDGSLLSIATRKVLDAGGKELNRAGLTPAEAVEVSRSDLAAGRDPQLQRALAVLGVKS